MVDIFEKKTTKQNKNEMRDMVVTCVWLLSN